MFFISNKNAMHYFLLEAIKKGGNNINKLPTWRRKYDWGKVSIELKFVIFHIHSQVFLLCSPNDPFSPPSNLYAIDQYSVRKKLTCRHLLYFWCFTGRWNMHICTSNSHFVVKTARNKILQNKKVEVKNFKFDLYFPSTKFRGILSEINNEYLIRYSHRFFWYGRPR